MGILKLLPNQVPAFERAITIQNCALLCKQRTGKTYITGAIMQHEMHDEFCGLIVCKLSNRDSTWRKFLDEFIHINVSSDWEEFKRMPKPKVFLCHYEMLMGIYPELKNYSDFNWACVDEAQQIASRGNVSSRAMKLLRWIPRKLALTGTPIDKLLTDAFGIFRFLDHTIFGDNYAAFEYEYLKFRELSEKQWENARKRGRDGIREFFKRQAVLKKKAVFNPEKMDQFISLIAPHCITMTEADVGIIMPNLTKVSIPMTPEQKRVYNTLKRDSVVRLEDDSSILCQLTITRIMKLRQVAQGFIYDEEEHCHILGKNKLKWLIDKMNRTEMPVVIFTVFNPENRIITAALKREGYKVARVSGKFPKKKSDRTKIWLDFQNDKYDALVVQVKVGGVGIDLWNANTGIVYSMGHSFRDWDQSIARLNHYDKKRPSEFYFLLSENSIDNDIYSMIMLKQLTSKQVLARLKSKYKTKGGIR